MRWRSIVFIGILLSAALGSYLAISAALFAEAMGCEQSVLERKREPSGTRVLVVARFECGATADDATGVFLVAHPGTSKLVPSEAIFAADAGATFRVEWAVPSTIRIREVRANQVFRRLTRASDVEVEYPD